jgi:hypothetical protein
LNLRPLPCEGRVVVIFQWLSGVILWHSSIDYRHRPCRLSSGADNGHPPIRAAVGHCRTGCHSATRRTLCGGPGDPKGSQISLALLVWPFSKFIPFMGGQHDASVCPRCRSLLLSCAWTGSRAGHSGATSRKLEDDFVDHLGYRRRSDRTIWSQC